MDVRYSLSKSNKVYFSVVAILYIAAFSVGAEKTSYQFGELVGTLLSMLLFPLLFAWIIWRLSGRGKRGGSWSFNIVLTMALLGQFGQYSNRLEQEKLLEEMQAQKEEFKRKTSASESPEEFTSAYREFSDSVLGSLDGLQRRTSGTERKVFGILTELLKESHATARKWNRSLNTIQEERILDYSLLNSDEEVEYQKAAVKRYIEDTQIYGESVLNFVPELKSRLADFTDSNEVAKGIIAGAQNRLNSQKQSLGPLMKAHVRYGTGLLELLEMLQRNRDKWFFKHDELHIEDDDLLKRHNKMVEALGNVEQQINSLSESLHQSL